MALIKNGKGCFNTKMQGVKCKTTEICNKTFSRFSYLNIFTDLMSIQNSVFIAEDPG